MPKKGTKSRKGTDDEPKQEEKNKLPEHLEVQRTRVVCKGDAPVNVSILPRYSSFCFRAVFFNYYQTPIYIYIYACVYIYSVNFFAC